MPDVTTYPALAGAVTPIFNIPELKAITNETLLLSRLTVSYIFRGKIRCWSHEIILADQLKATNKNPQIRATLINLGGVGGIGGNTCTDGKIKVVVRQDSSGTSDIFSGGISKFESPSTALGALNAYDPSFAVQVTGNNYISTTLSGQEKPYWCG